MLKYIERILNTVIEFGVCKECRDLANILLEDLATIRFGVLHQEIDSISFMEEFAGNMFLADEITKSMKNMGKIYSVSRVENSWDGCEKESRYDDGIIEYRDDEEKFESYHYDGFYDYRDEEALFESYMDYLDGLHTSGKEAKSYEDFLEILNNKQKGNNQ